MATGPKTKTLANLGVVHTNVQSPADAYYDYSFAPRHKMVVPPAHWLHSQEKNILWLAPW
jgi:hypothetical protein